MKAAKPFLIRAGGCHVALRAAIASAARAIAHPKVWPNVRSEPCWCPGNSSSCDNREAIRPRVAHGPDICTWISRVCIRLMLEDMKFIGLVTLQKRACCRQEGLTRVACALLSQTPVWRMRQRQAARTK